MCKTKCNLAFQRYYGNDKADSEQNYSLEAVLLYTEGTADAGDQIRRKYSCIQGTNIWPFRLFMEIVG
jgi:hypothetical protein